jgi:3-oxoacyl-[acyl-carrier-protein] synthase II
MSHDISVVVTGLGAITPLGADVNSTWSALIAGHSGVHPLTEGWAESMPARIAARVMVDPATLLERTQARHMDRCEQFALIAAREAWRQAGAPVTEPERTGVAFSSGIGGMATALDGYEALTEKGWRRTSPYTVPMQMANGSAGWIGLELGARAGVHSPASACSSGAEAIGYGIEMIRSGRADVVLAGGTEAPIHRGVFAAFAAMRALSTHNEEPERASCPFNKGRDGFVFGEGAAAVVLESAAHAARRAADVLAVAVGVGYSSDAYHIVHPAPDGAGAALAIRRALANGALTVEQVAHINAHATSTMVGDLAEALAIRQVFGDAARHLVVSATKSMTGHLIGGAGALESILAICALRDSVAPPTINVDDPDDEIAAAGISVTAHAREFRHNGTDVALSHSFAFGGHNVVLAFAMREAA